MTVQRGFSGDLVRQIQQRLSDLKFLSGPIDGAFGGGTEAAVKNFQQARNVAVTGAVDAATWNLLFPGQPAPQSPLANVPLINRCLALTGSFETGKQPPDCFCGLAGDFDGQGISFGALQWNVGQGTLQDILKDMFEQHALVCSQIFHENTNTLQSLSTASTSEQLTFARSIQNQGQINEPWKGMLIALGLTPECQSVQVKHATGIFNQALALCPEYGLKSQRAAALMFDILTQNGGIGTVTKSQIQAAFAGIQETVPQDGEIARMRIVANQVAAHSRPQYVDDVRTRKLVIANGSGSVHGNPYDLANVFCLTLDDLAGT